MYHWMLSLPQLVLQSSQMQLKKSHRTWSTERSQCVGSQHDNGQPGQFHFGNCNKPIRVPCNKPCAIVEDGSRLSIASTVINQKPLCKLEKGQPAPTDLKWSQTAVAKLFMMPSTRFGNSHLSQVRKAVCQTSFFLFAGGTDLSWHSEVNSPSEKNPGVWKTIMDIFSSMYKTERFFFKVALFQGIF